MFSICCDLSANTDMTNVAHIFANSWTKSSPHKFIHFKTLRHCKKYYVVIVVILTILYMYYLTRTERYIGCLTDDKVED